MIYDRPYREIAGRQRVSEAVTRVSDDFFIRLERQLEAAELRELNRAPALRRMVGPRRRLSVALAAAAAVGVAVVVLAGLGTMDKHEPDRRPQPVGTVPAPSKKVVVTDVGWDVERGMRFGLAGRRLTVQLLPPALNNQTFVTLSRGSRISATCGANVAAPPGDPRRATTLTRRWPVGQTSMSFRFPRDVSRWCRLDDRSGSILGFARFRGASPGTSELITEAVINWGRLFASSPHTCNKYTDQNACEQITCRWAGGKGKPIKGCWLIDPTAAATFRGATVQELAIGGDRALVTLSTSPDSPATSPIPGHHNEQTLQVRRAATGEWLIDKLGAE